MEERKIFSVGMRLIGIYLLGMGLVDGFVGLLTYCGLPALRSYTGLDRITAMLAYSAGGISLIALAPLMGSILYRPSRRADRADPPAMN